MKRNKQNKKRGGRFGLLGWGMALLLLIGGGGFGLYQSGVLGDSDNIMGGDGAVDVPGETGVVNLTISGNDIAWNDETISEEELTNRVAEADEDAAFTVVDDQAIKATYEAVLTILENYQVSYLESEAL